MVDRKATKSMTTARTLHPRRAERDFCKAVSQENQNEEGENMKYMVTVTTMLFVHMREDVERQGSAARPSRENET
jgi:cob(I)alamin adenosyltransferase